MRNALLLALVVAFASPAVPTHAGSLPPLTTSVRLYTWRGHWRPVAWKSMATNLPLRIAVRVRTPSSPATRISVGFALHHVSWQGFYRVVQTADVRGQLRQTMRVGHVAHFQAILRMPVTHPLLFSRVVITVRHGTQTRTVVSGVTFEPPATPAQAALQLTVPQVFAFCAARRGLPFLTYAVAVRGYVRGVYTRGDGPPAYVVLADPASTNNLSMLERRHEGFPAGGFLSGSATRLTNRAIMIVGGVACGSRVRFDITGSSR